ncbi:MAG TPA: hypothetical protein VMG10_05505 [Gemmataceae bacterium]|nr:hypothetical protein [Gemmataceae bacterium]
MTTDYQGQVEELLDQAASLPDGPSKVALLEEAVRLADVHQDVILGDTVRAKLIEAATFSGYPEKALVAFSWRLGQCDRNPTQFPESKLLWQYKWIASKLDNFPQISRQQIEDAFDDMTRRYQRAGAKLRPIFEIRWDMALAMGEPDQARKYYRLWEKAPRDSHTDCLACEQQGRVYFHVEMGKNVKALELAEQILRGRMRCRTIPHRTYAQVLMPLLKLRQVEKAVEYHRKGYRLIRNNLTFLYTTSAHLTFLVLTDNLLRALKMFEDHLGWALNSKDPYACWRFYLAAHLLMSRLAESGQTTFKLRLPKTAPCYQEGSRYEVSDLASWIHKTCLDLATRFDARNGNDSFVRRLKGQGRLKRWLRPYPLGRARKGE